MTPNPHANPIPNILTGLRLIAGVIMFLILAGAAPQGIPLLSEYLSPEDQFRFGRHCFFVLWVPVSADGGAGAPRFGSTGPGGLTGMKDGWRRRARGLG